MLRQEGKNHFPSSGLGSALSCRLVGKAWQQQWQKQHPLQTKLGAQESHHHQLLSAASGPSPKFLEDSISPTFLDSA